MLKKINKPLIILVLLTVIGGFLHFYKLNWGAPFYFHPDERNIASAVSQLQFPNQMNPHFFAYGSLPIYIIYFTGYITNYFLSFLQPKPFTLNPSFEQAIFVSRVYSAIFATFLIPILFFIGKKLKNAYTGLLAAFFTTASIGFIQFAHFGTFEMWLTFFSILLFWCCLSVFEKKKFVSIIFLAFLFGILMAIKISSVVLAPLPIISLLSLKKTKHNFFSSAVLPSISRILFFSLLAFLLYILTNPYGILDTKDFRSSINYESGVALGTESVFYTGNFLDTVPVIYQFLHVYPFLINPLMTILFIPTFAYLLFETFKTKNSSHVILYTFFLILFLSQAFLFVKWTRYLMPTVPFMYVIISIALSNETIEQYLFAEISQNIFTKYSPCDL